MKYDFLNVDSCTQLTFPNHPLKKITNYQKKKNTKKYNLFRNNRELPDIAKGYLLVLTKT